MSSYKYLKYKTKYMNLLRGGDQKKELVDKINNSSKYRETEDYIRDLAILIFKDQDPSLDVVVYWPSIFKFYIKKDDYNPETDLSYTSGHDGKTGYKPINNDNVLRNVIMELQTQLKIQDPYTDKNMDLLDRLFTKIEIDRLMGYNRNEKNTTTVQETVFFR